MLRKKDTKPPDPQDKTQCVLSPATQLVFWSFLPPSKLLSQHWLWDVSYLNITVPTEEDKIQSGTQVCQGSPTVLLARKYT